MNQQLRQDFFIDYQAKEVVVFDRVSFSYQMNFILKDISFSIKKGDKVAVIGASGCGKSTILKLILGFLKPTKGEVFVFGVPMSRASNQAILTVRKKIGMLFQSSALFDSMCVKDNILFPLRDEQNRLPDNAVQRLEEVLSFLELEGQEEKYPSELSGGQQKRVGLARALIYKPALMLYDEPTTGLDPILSQIIENVINKLNNKEMASSIVVSHQPSTILRTSELIYYVSNQTIQGKASTEEVLKKNNSDVLNFIEGAVL